MTDSAPFTLTSIPSLARFAVYVKAIECAKLIYAIRCRASLRSQMLRAMDSVVLNIAEGAGERTPDAKRRYWAIARASLFETAAAVDLAAITRSEDSIPAIGGRLAELDRILGALTRR